MIPAYNRRGTARRALVELWPSPLRHRLLWAPARGAPTWWFFNDHFLRADRGSVVDRLYPEIYIFAMPVIYTTEEFDSWFTKLRDKEAIRRIQMRIDRAEGGNLGDCAPVGEGVLEMRIHYGPGYRVYFFQKDKEIVILLAGGNKSTQSKDIKTAQTIARQL